MNSWSTSASASVSTSFESVKHEQTNDDCQLAELVPNVTSNFSSVISELEKKLLKDYAIISKTHDENTYTITTETNMIRFSMQSGDIFRDLSSYKLEIFKLEGNELLFDFMLSPISCRVAIINLILSYLTKPIEPVVMNCFSSLFKTEDLSSLTEEERRLSTFKKQFPHIPFSELQPPNSLYAHSTFDRSTHFLHKPTKQIYSYNYGTYKWHTNSSLGDKLKRQMFGMSPRLELFEIVLKKRLLEQHALLEANNYDTSYEITTDKNKICLTKQKNSCDVFETLKIFNLNGDELLFESDLPNHQTNETTCDLIMENVSKPANPELMATQLSSSV